jgi:hypothetical protein
MGEKRMRLAFEGMSASTFPLALKLSSKKELRLAVDFRKVVHSVHERLMSPDRCRSKT